MTLAEIRAAITTAETVVYRTTQVQPDHKLDSKLRGALQVLEAGLDDAPDSLEGHLSYFCFLIRSCGALDIPFKATKGYRSIESQAKLLIRMLEARKPTSN